MNLTRNQIIQNAINDIASHMLHQLIQEWQLDGDFTPAECQTIANYTFITIHHNGRPYPSQTFAVQLGTGAIRTAA
jgi:hypothetical protein